MKAVVLAHRPTVAGPATLQDIQLEQPMPGAQDLRIRVEAVSVNPVDTKLRARGVQAADPPRVLGFDAAGVVDAIGGEVTGFEVGEAVYYAGDVTRPGSNAQYQLVDARLVAHKPRTLDFAQAAALPLTALTAWELLFERMPYSLDGGGSGRTLLVVGGAGGVGSIAIQLAKLAGFRVVATASRMETLAWCRLMGADDVIDHRQALGPQLEALGVQAPEAAINLADTDRYWDELGDLLAPQGHVGLIVEPSGPLRIGDPYKAKCIGIHWEFMFTRSRFRTADMGTQGRILAQVAGLVDAGRLRGTLSDMLSPIDAGTLDEAHRRVASGGMVGKLVLAGW